MALNIEITINHNKFFDFIIKNIIILPMPLATKIFLTHEASTGIWRPTALSVLSSIMELTHLGSEARSSFTPGYFRREVSCKNDDQPQAVS